MELSAFRSAEWDESEGNYRTFYSGNEDGKRQHGVGIYMHSTATSGEFDIQPVNERIMWANGAIYGVKQTVFSVYAPTNKTDNAAEVDNFYSTLERQVSAVRTKYGLETKWGRVCKRVLRIRGNR